jgi:hypothetical protein
MRMFMEELKAMRMCEILANIVYLECVDENVHGRVEGNENV